MRLLICIPTYNEKDNVRPLANEIFKYCPQDTDILFIDDNSPDGTSAEIRSMMATDPRVHLLQRPGKMGLGTAYIQAFEWGLQRQYDWFLEMDADFSHDPAHLVAFRQAMLSGDCDVVLGSRYCKNGGVENWSKFRLLLSKAGTWYSTAWLRFNLSDWTGGFNGWSRKTLEQLVLQTVKSKGYSFQIELKYRALLLGQRVKELPIVFKERRAGQSKMSGSIVKEAVVGVVRLRWREIEGRVFQ